MLFISDASKSFTKFLILSYWRPAVHKYLVLAAYEVFYILSFISMLRQRLIERHYFQVLYIEPPFIRPTFVHINNTR